MLEDTHGAEEERMIAAARRGDLASFNWLVLRYQARVFNLCLRMLSDPDAAADATQDTFLSAYRAIGRFAGGQFKAWLLRIASNACLDALRSRKRRTHQSIERGNLLHRDGEEEGEALQIRELDPRLDPEESLLNAETVEIIQRGLDLLPDDQRIALILVDVQGLSYEEASIACGANLGTLKSRINRARHKMRDYLGGHGVFPPGELSTLDERSTSDS